MSVPMYGQTFTLAQMDKAVRYAHSRVSSIPLELEDIAYTVCEATNLPMIDILSALQRLKEWKESQEDRSA